MNEAIAACHPPTSRRRTPRCAGRRSCARAARRCARRSSSVPTRRGCSAGTRASSIASSPSIWRDLGAPADIALVAVGGYGRGELFPHSDVDVLILLPGWLDPAGTAFVERLIGVLWDIGLEMGHSVRTIAAMRRRDGRRHHRQDEPPRASLRRRLAARCIAPSPAASPRRWTFRRSTKRKMLEQQQRHLKYHDTAYNLEPNVKESPGGLRDLQTVLWIARAAGVGRGWRELAQAGLITMQEARTVSRQERLIGALRVRLHYLTDRREDRLVFDVQNALAREIGLRRHADAARERAADATLLPRGEDRAAGERHPAAEPARAALPDRRPSRSPIDDDFVRDRRAPARARRDAVRAPAGGDARRVPDHAAPPRVEGHVGADVARAVAQPPSRRRPLPPRHGEPRAIHRAAARSRAASRTSCGG